MAVSFSGIAGSNVTISGSVTTTTAGLGTGQTLLNYSGSTTAATVTIATVPANTVFYITSIGITATSSSSGAFPRIKLNGKIALAANLLAAAGNTCNSQINFITPFKLTAGELIQYTADGSDADYFITGWSEAV